MEICWVCKNVLSGSVYDDEKAFTVCDRCSKETRAHDVRHSNGNQVHGREQSEGSGRL